MNKFHFTWSEKTLPSCWKRRKFNGSFDELDSETEPHCTVEHMKSFTFHRILSNLNSTLDSLCFPADVKEATRKLITLYSEHCKLQFEWWGNKWNGAWISPDSTTNACRFVRVIYTLMHGKQGSSLPRRLIFTVINLISLKLVKKYSRVHIITTQVSVLLFSVYPRCTYLLFCFYFVSRICIAARTSLLITMHF